MASVHVDFDPADHLDEVATEDLQAELTRRTQKGPELDPDVFGTVRRWAERAPPALADEMRAWLFANQPPLAIKPEVLRTGYPI